MNPVSVTDTSDHDGAGQTDPRRGGQARPRDPPRTGLPAASVAPAAPSSALAPFRRAPGRAGLIALADGSLCHGQVLIRRATGAGSRGGGGAEEQERGRGDDLVKSAPSPTRVMKGKSVKDAGTQRWLSLQIDAGTAHGDR